MGVTEIVSLVTVAIPFVTAIAKKAFNTNRLKNPYKKGVNTLIPIILGILSSGLIAYSNGMDWMSALAVGLGSGGAASSIRNVEKNIVGIVGAVAKIFKSK